MTRPVHEVRLPPFKIALFIFVVLIFISLSFLAGYKAGVSATKEEKPSEKKFISSSWKEVYQLEQQPPQAQSKKPAVVEKPVQGKKTLLKSKPGRKATLKKEITGNYAVQVAAFTSKERANREAERYRRKGYHTSILIEVTSGKKFYKVLVGPYKTLEEARVIKKRLEREEKKKLLLRRLN